VALSLSLLLNGIVFEGLGDAPVRMKKGRDAGWVKVCGSSQKSPSSHASPRKVSVYATTHSRTDLHDTGRLAACRSQVDPLQKSLGPSIFRLLWCRDCSRQHVWRRGSL